MITLIFVLKVVFQTVRGLWQVRSDLILENVALRQQVAVLSRTTRRIPLRPEDRTCSGSPFAVVGPAGRRP